MNLKVPGQVQGLAPGLEQSPQYRLGNKRTESSPIKKILGVLVENLDMKWQHALSAQKTENHMLGCTRSVFTL